MINVTELKFVKPIVVLKFGGSSLQTVDHIKKAALKIKECYDKGHLPIVVASAMGTTTNQLEGLAREVTPEKFQREWDMLMSTGERISTSLLTMALLDLGVPAISYTGSQAGILTSSTHTDAEIVELRPIRVNESLGENKVVVIAGFQGVNPTTKEITTLGRGGSDITAIAFAAHYKAKYCQFVKDVPGVFPVDPKIITQPSEPFRALESSKLFLSCCFGAKVLHPRALNFSIENAVPLKLGLITETQDKDCTMISGETENNTVSVTDLPLVSNSENIGFASSEAFEKIKDHLLALNLPQPFVALPSDGNDEFIIALPPSSFEALNGNDTQNRLNLRLSNITTFVCHSAQQQTRVVNVLSNLGKKLIAASTRNTLHYEALPNKVLNQVFTQLSPPEER